MGRRAPWAGDAERPPLLLLLLSHHRTLIAAADTADTAVSAVSAVSAVTAENNDIETETETALRCERSRPSLLGDTEEPLPQLACTRRC